MKYKCRAEASSNLKQEIKSIANKGYNTVLISDNVQKDKRRFTKIFDIRLNELIFQKGIERKYVEFFILLVNINSRYIQPDLNLINLPIKKIAENMEYSIVHTYNCLKVLKNYNIIDYYKRGKSNFIVINPCYYARFYDIRYLYYLENAFKSKDTSVSDTIDSISDFRIKLQNKKNSYVESQIKQYMKEQYNN